MPVPSNNLRKKSRATTSAGVRPSGLPASGLPVFSLVLIDQSRLQRAAWAEYHTARKRHEKAARDLHRHEEIDTPAYEQWLNQTFPVHSTDLRNLQQEVSTKKQQIRFIRAIAAQTGRSAKRLWAEFKQNAGTPRDAGDDPTSDDARKSRRHHPDNDDDFFSDRDDPPPYRGRGQSSAGRHAQSAARNNSPIARDIYRRLVQKLHPDRGGEFTPARQRLWHEVQQAWAEADADWLARLEVELDSTADLGLLGLRESDPLNVNSPLSRLRRAVTELYAARRDIERKLREYRTTPPWRFTLAKKRAILERRTLAQFEEDMEILNQQLDYLNRTIRLWEEPSLGRVKPRHTAPNW